MNVVYPYIGSKLIMTKPVDGIGLEWEPHLNFIQDQSNNWRESITSAHEQVKTAPPYLNGPYIVLLPEICLSSETGDAKQLKLKGILNITLSYPKSSRLPSREISLRVDEEVQISEYTESPPQLLYPQSYKQSHLIKKGENLRLELMLAGKPVPQVSWFHNDEEVQNGGRIYIKKSESNTVLEIQEPRACDFGCYEIRARNYLSECKTYVHVDHCT